MTTDKNKEIFNKLKRPIIKSYTDKIYDDKTKYYSYRLSNKEKRILDSRHDFKKIQ